jgi:urease accessory protein
VRETLRRQPVNPTGDNMTFSLILKPASRTFLALVLGLGALPAMAHPGDLHVEGFISGMLHPMTGWDHVLAFLAVGMWSAQQTRTAKWSLPVLFLACMALSAALPLAGVGLPSLEAGVAASVAILGLMIANGFRFAPGMSAGIIAVFAGLHGYTHGLEIPGEFSGAGMVLFGAGFIAATALLHVCGLLLGMAAERAGAGRFIQVTGSAIAMSGMVLLSAAL